MNAAPFPNWQQLAEAVGAGMIICGIIQSPDAIPKLLFANGISRQWCGSTILRDLS